MNSQTTYESVGRWIELVQWHALAKVVISSVSITSLNFLTSPRRRLGKQQVDCLIHYTRESNGTFSAIDLAAPAPLPQKQLVAGFTIRFYGGLGFPFPVEGK
jgi:hypothetical protein